MLILLWCPNVYGGRGPLQPLSKNEINLKRNFSGVKKPGELDSVNGKRSRPGPKPKPLEHRKYQPGQPTKRIVHRYSREKKIAVLMFLTHHRVLENTKTGFYRPPTQQEAATWFKISQQVISDWWRNKDKILDMKKGHYRIENTRWMCEWPEMEKELFDIFLQQRQKGRLVRRGWFRRSARRLFKQYYGSDNIDMFVFSIGWFMGFQRRWGISCRALTKKAQHLPEEYRRLVINWLRFNRRHCSEQQFPLNRILNIDEIPIPFEYFEGKTYDLKGSHTISARTHRSGWDKRQATLILYIFADGVGSRIKPKIIFHGVSGSGNRILGKEKHLYHPEVTIEFNPTAYNTEDLFLKFFDEELFPSLGISDFRNPPPQKTLLLLDVFAGHTTDTVLSKLRSANIITSLIPGGCTGLLQPLDTAVNKPFKGYLREFTDQYIDEQEEKLGCEVESWSVSDKRVMTTHVVARAWEAFCKEKRELIQKSFRDVGVTLPVDGSEDSLLKVKGFEAEDLAKEITLNSCAKNLPEPIAYQSGETYRELPIPGEDSFCLEYTWQAENYLGFPKTKTSNNTACIDLAWEPAAKGGNITDLKETPKTNRNPLNEFPPLLQPSRDSAQLVGMERPPKGGVLLELY